MRTFLLLSLLIVMIPGVSLNAQECHCDDIVVETHSCCSESVDVQKESCKQCSCDMSHTVAMLPIQQSSSQALHVNTHYNSPKSLITKSLTIPLCEPPNSLA